MIIGPIVSLGQLMPAHLHLGVMFFLVLETICRQIRQGSGCSPMNWRMLFSREGIGLSRSGFTLDHV
jgi:hypothetical protein